MWMDQTDDTTSSDSAAYKNNPDLFSHFFTIFDEEVRSEKESDAETVRYRFSIGVTQQWFSG